MSSEADPAARASIACAVGEIWLRSRARTLARVDALEVASIAVLQGTLTEDQRRTAEREAHRLAGTVGTFGFAAGSRLARAIEQTFEQLASLPPDAAFELCERVVALRHELESPAPTPAAAESASSSTAESVLVISSDSERAELILAEASARQIQAALVPSVASARAQLDTRVPAAVVLDIGTGSEREAGLALLEQLGANQPPTPVLVLSSDQGLEARLEVARRGGIGPVSPAVHASEILNDVARLLQRLQPVPFTVLAVDDDPQILCGCCSSRTGFRS